MQKGTVLRETASMGVLYAGSGGAVWAVRVRQKVKNSVISITVFQLQLTRMRIFIQVIQFFSFS
jgi:hypothetical protein